MPRCARNDKKEVRNDDIVTARNEVTRQSEEQGDCTRCARNDKKEVHNDKDEEL